MKKTLMLAFFALLSVFTSLAYALDDNLTYKLAKIVTPEGIVIKSVADSGHSVFVMPYKNGIYQTDDAGKNWALIKNGLRDNDENVDLFFDKEGKLVLATKHGIYQLTANGQLQETAGGKQLSLNNTNEITVANLIEGNDGTWYVVLHSSTSDHSAYVKIFKSLDQGETWENIPADFYMYNVEYQYHQLAVNSKGDLYFLIGRKSQPYGHLGEIYKLTKGQKQKRWPELRMDTITGLDGTRWEAVSDLMYHEDLGPTPKIVNSTVKILIDSNDDLLAALDTRVFTTYGSDFPSMALKYNGSSWAFITNSNIGGRPSYSLLAGATDHHGNVYTASDSHDFYKGGIYRYKENGWDPKPLVTGLNPNSPPKLVFDNDDNLYLIQEAKVLYKLVPDTSATDKTTTAPAK